MNLKSQIRHSWIAAILLIVLTPAAATACTCAVIPLYRCETEWKRGEAIFVGKVIAMDSITSNARYMIAVRFSVTDSLLSDTDVGQETVVYTGTGGGDCGYPFIVGAALPEKYLN